LTNNIELWYRINRALDLNHAEGRTELIKAKENKMLNLGNTTHKAHDNLIHSSAKNIDLIEKRHKQIVDGACQIFFKKGYHPTTIRDIAQACGMSMGQLYHYISSKDDVLYLVHNHMQKVWDQHMENADLPKIKDPLQRLIKALDHGIEFIVENRKLFQFVFTESRHLNKKHLRMVLGMVNKDIISFWRQLLKEVNKKKSIRCERDFAASLIAYLVLFLALRKWSLRGRSTKKNSALLIDFILRGLGVIQ
jgi:AcrR family transcriptional regulator